jgi:hypothetical protein
MINIIVTINADDSIDFSLASYGFGLNFSPQKNNTESSLGLFNVFFHNSETNISLKLTPLHIKTYIEATDNEETKSVTYFSFVNINMYWNCLERKEMVLGPFCSLEYLTIRDWERLDFKDVTISTGIKYSYKSNDINLSSINFHSYDSFYLLEAEVGYRYNYFDGHQFYFNMKTDLMLMILTIGDILESIYKLERNGIIKIR